MVVRPHTFSHRLPESSSGFHSVGVVLRDLRTWGASDHRQHIPSRLGPRARRQHNDAKARRSRNPHCPAKIIFGARTFEKSRRVPYARLASLWRDSRGGCRYAFDCSLHRIAGAGVVGGGVAASGSTWSVRPSTRRTTTSWPGGKAEDAIASHNSPWTKTFPCGESTVCATPVSPTSPWAPVTTLLRRALRAMVMRKAVMRPSGMLTANAVTR